MKVKSVFFYQAVKIGSKVVNSAHEDNFEISYEDNLCFIFDQKQDIRIAVPATNIPQMQVSDKQPAMTNIEKARLAKAMKALE